MKYIVALILLFILELLYFKIADRFNIIDKPNDRSSHTSITLRGGGVIFYFGALVFFIYSSFQYPWFLIGLSLMAVVSFLDDIFTLSNKVRLCIHFLSVLLMAYELDLFDLPWFYLLLGFIVVVGVINTFNFMDGINGITACYSLAVGALLLIVNNQIGFVIADLLYFSIIAILVFSFFNFRTKAKCFAGDVGSVSIAYILIFVLGLLILKTGNLIYMLFLVVYGIDAVWTIIRRLYNKENIFEAHRSHLYQFLGNEAGVNKLFISFLYGIIQFGIGFLVILFAEKDSFAQITFALILILILSILYLIIKTIVIKKYVNSHHGKYTNN